MDLDGTLIAGDSSWELLLALAKSRPLDLLRVPFWLASGRARLKQEMAVRASVDPSLFPYRADLLEFLREEKRNGRKLVLATGAHRSIAEGVAAHLQLFDEVAATEGNINLTGPRKLDELNRRFGPGQFDYIGDSTTDLCLWQNARRAYVIASGKRLVRRAAQVCEPARVFDAAFTPAAAIKALRPVQWIKNLLVILPLILAHQIGNRGKVIGAIVAFASFSMAASAIYILNDLLDLEADRRHHRKRFRPFAAGQVRVSMGLIVMGALLLIALAAATELPAKFVAWLGAYILLTTLYSFWLKRKLLLDVIVLASLYTLRIIAGAAAIDVMLTMWLLAFSMFFFLSLAFAKRYSELLGVEDTGGEVIKGREYRITDLRIIESVGPASGYLSVMVFCNYLDSDMVRRLYPQPQILWLEAPLLLYWITRIWFIARRRKMDDDPIVFAIRDRVSRLTGIVAAVIILAAWAPKPHWWPF